MGRTFLYTDIDPKSGIFLGVWNSNRVESYRVYAHAFTTRVPGDQVKPEAVCIMVKMNGNTSNPLHLIGGSIEFEVEMVILHINRWRSPDLGLSGKCEEHQNKVKKQPHGSFQYWMSKIRI